MLYSLRPVVSAPRRFCAPSFLRPIVSAPHRFCAPSFLLLMASSAVSLLLAPPAHAQSGPPGYYSSPTITGGQATSQSSPKPAPYSMNPGTGYYGATATSTGLSCGGQIETKWTWTPRIAGTPPPQQVIVKQFSNASWGSSTASGQCDDGLSSPKDPLVSTTSSTGYTSTTSAGTRYSMAPADANGNVTLNCTPTAKIDASSCGVSYQPALVSPVTIAIGGAIQDSSGNLNILVGQKCSATLSGIPSGGGWSATYQWSVSGTTFQDWEPATPQIGTTPANPQASYFLGGSGPLTNPSAHWYWNDPNQATETISCTATVTPPAGQGSAFPVTATQQVSVQLPQWTASGVGGYMQVNTFDLAYPASDYAFYAGPTDAMDKNGQPGGINFKATSITPPLFGQGSLEMVQLVTPSLSYTTNTKPPVVHTDPEQSQGLDVHYPKSSNGASGEGATPYQANDIPGMDLTAYNAGAASEKHQFIDYLLYLPPASNAGSSMWITLAQFNWSVNGTATLPGSGLWSDYVAQNGSDNAGTVTPSGTATPFTSVYGPDFFVSWTKINVFPSF